MLADTGAIQDMEGRPSVLQGYPALQVGKYVGDAVVPKLVAFDLNMTTEILSLTFSETVDPTTWNASLFVLQDGKTASAPTAQHTYTLTNGTSYAPSNDHAYNAIVLVKLSVEDFGMSRPNF